MALKTLPRNDSGGPAVSPDVWALHVRYADSPDPAVLDELVAEYHDYAASLARKMWRDGESMDDLVQIALEALVRAIQGFDPQRGIPFPGYGSPTILGALKRHYRDSGWALRVPRRVHEVLSASVRTTEELTAKLGQAPSNGEVAEALGVEVATLLMAQEAGHARSTWSLDTPVAEEDGAPVADLIGAADPLLDLAVNRVALHEAIDDLDPRDREVLHRYYFEGATQTEIARRFGVSQMQVSRWIRRVLVQLRASM